MRNTMAYVILALVAAVLVTIGARKIIEFRAGEQHIAQLRSDVENDIVPGMSYDSVVRFFDDRGIWHAYEQKDRTLRAYESDIATGVMGGTDVLVDVAFDEQMRVVSVKVDRMNKAF